MKVQKKKTVEVEAVTFTCYKNDLSNKKKKKKSNNLPLQAIKAKRTATKATFAKAILILLYYLLSIFWFFYLRIQLVHIFISRE